MQSTEIDAKLNRAYRLFQEGKVFDANEIIKTITPHKMKLSFGEDGLTCRFIGNDIEDILCSYQYAVYADEVIACDKDWNVVKVLKSRCAWRCP